MENNQLLVNYLEKLDEYALLLEKKFETIKQLLDNNKNETNKIQNLFLEYEDLFSNAKSILETETIKSFFLHINSDLESHNITEEEKKTVDKFIRAIVKLDEINKNMLSRISSYNTKNSERLLLIRRAKIIMANLCQLTFSPLPKFFDRKG